MTMVSACPACEAAPLAQDRVQASEIPTLYLSVPGMHCAACIAKIERRLSALPGVAAARVNLSLKRVSLVAPGLEPETAVEALQDIGFAAFPLDTATLAPAADRTGRDLLMRLAVAGFAMMNVMLLSVAVWSGAQDATRDLFHLISAMIALPVVIYSGQPFFRSAWAALKARGLNMDVPISLAILLAAGMSLYETLNSGRHAYFDAALSLTFFLLIGRYLDHRSRSEARSAAQELSALEVRRAQRLREGRTEQVPLSELVVGDRLLIPTGARVPVDGVLQGGGALTDRSFLTGESEAVALEAGAVVQAGEVNLGPAIEVTATAVGPDTTLRRVAALVETAETARNRYTALADRAAQVYAPVVHLLALVAFLGWVAFDGDVRHALNVAIAVLIITCPCALGLAVPAVATAAIGRLYRLGVLVKSGTALERLAEIDTVVFDKTGTLTLPGVDVDAEGFGATERSVLRALSQSSDHPVSRALAETLAEVAPAELSGITEVRGCGIEGRLGARIVRLGKGSWLGEDTSALCLRIGNDPALPVPTSERLRPGARETVAALQEAGLVVKLVSGDCAERVADVAASLGIEDARAEVSAEAKHDLLSGLALAGHRVLMVGDGLNDTAALAAAHVSIAPSSALDASRNAADVVLLRDGMETLPQLHRVACAAVHLSRQNFTIATLYNIVAVPIALAGLATPLIAALAMSTSSVTVLLNALRIRRVP
ncbi:heavy metal translocating P-type ATPase [Sulfitobacter sp. D35]|uniref:heavy metal translocating P-type ATPase n=1 Tax=Sulfitobacter sp. D35 TaxID=3083252 RepID=UPI00296F4214|nr:heavy metal translocating P-type ATPase [Sulfitobacter sp. D35]MDW4498567.1 heavy metal translocating P-type ATPase [Sulfitobacter sp. D35]